MAAMNVIGPYSPKEFSAIGTLGTRMTTEIEALTGYNGSKIVSVEPVVVLGNIYLVIYQKP
jgi:hypothetical protein